MTSTHGILGDWFIASYALSISSIITSTVCVIAVIGYIFWDRLYLNRTSFRLSASIAASNLVSSACRLCTYHSAFMAEQSGTRLRILYWLQSAGDLCVVFLTMSISLHLLLTVLMRKLYIARRLQQWYEVICVFLALLISHPILYMYKKVEWDGQLQMLVFDGVLPLYRKSQWPVYLAWVLLGIVFCLCASIGVVFILKVSPPVSGKHNSSISSGPRTPSASERSATWEELTLSPLRGQNNDGMKSIALRIACYGSIPLITQLWSVVCNLSPSATWIYGMAYSMPSTTGLLCLLLLTGNASAI
ncbi:hypothetical protein GGI19_000015 [Coemansia pectinata]|uniref:Uncharacterized protein n=1 Tax=Coemansia pectinata TaxID=1052879 RepID=A0A9W8H0B1_9FUNG|nr:hypothetical protein GGI19_000015 [Coemansia pectinata]